MDGSRYVGSLFSFQYSCMYNEINPIGAFPLTNNKVILYSNETVLDSGVSTMIARDRGMELTIVYARDFEHLVELSEVICPNVILIDQSTLSHHNNLLHELLDRIENLRVITLDQHQNLLHVYTRHDVTILQASDLIQVIRSKTDILFAQPQKE